ncbi:hypothetical protein EASAB2608_06213 [Streptomyces sp. EAS-AB2608]|uniref:hypothetical protein n=1 Tax=Streptomyces sp. EAS-AB2608 TaxID=2779671 RepID=UPI001BEFEDBC|nr:hypothetical protein [Streptomyces sp. EAS-AB2608]BCM70879.1 hypothetical protein EASAB2608_06213 [Streptomyces sp. EAS-AB2608]
MRRRTTATILLAAALALAGCSNSSSGDSKPFRAPSVTPSAPASKSVADQIAACTDAIVAGKDEGDGAPECVDLSPDDYMDALQAANKKGRDALGKQLGDASALVGVSPECRTWIKAELLDSTEEIDATSGYEACGDLSDAELQAAIDAVEKQLVAESTTAP